MGNIARRSELRTLPIVIGHHEWWWLENPCGITNPPKHLLLFWFPQIQASRNAAIAKPIELVKHLHTDMLKGK
jgi:hypothetical protein